ncbi:MAG: hypothetical protein AAGA16_00525 [Cyanobacteria bacterium P01_E01_bin.35]
MSRNFASSMVQLSPSSGLDVHAYLVLKQKPTRQEQKLKTLHKYLQKYSSGWKKHLEMADLLYETGQWSEAITEYYLVIKEQPQVIKPYLKLGKILQLSNRNNEAVLVYTEALNLAKREATKQHLTGLIESCHGNIRAAIIAFKSATSLEPKNIVHWMALGQLQMVAEHLIVALATFKTVLDLDPNNFMGLIYSYDLLLALGNLPEAAKCLQHIGEIVPQDSQTLKRLITHRCRKKLVLGEEGKQTKKLINSLRKKASGIPEVNNLLARFYILRGEQDKGIKISKQFVAENSHNPHAWYYYSRCLSDIGKYETAADAIIKAYQLSLNRYYGNCDREIYRTLCEILPVAGRLEQARDMIAEMLTVFPESWSLWATAGRVLAEHFSENNSAADYSLYSTKIQPQLADTWLCHGKVLFLLGRYKAAVKSLTQSWQLLLPKAKNFQTVSTAFWLGESYQALKQNQSCRAWFEMSYQNTAELIEFDPVLAQSWQEKALARLNKCQGC